MRVPLSDGGHSGRFGWAARRSAPSPLSTGSASWWQGTSDGAALSAAVGCHGTSQSMRIIIATAPPLGAYHHRRFQEAECAAAGLELIGLLPGDGEPQRPGWVPLSRDPGLLADADALVVSGGGPSPWTAAVLAAARSLGLPSGFVELSWSSAEAVFPVPPDAAAAISVSSSDTVARLTGCQPSVVGWPRPPFEAPPQQRIALMLPIRTADTPDRQAQLFACAERLAAAGWHLKVATHPREQAPVLEGLAENVDMQNRHAQLRDVRLVVGTTTTRMIDAVVAQRPVLRVPSSVEEMDDHPVLRHCGPLVSPDQVVEAAETIRPLNAEQIEWIAGPDDPSLLSDWLVQLATSR